MKLKNKIIRRFTANFYGTSSIAKKASSLFIFLFYFIITTIILFKHIEIPKDVESAVKNIWIIPVIVFIWHASKLSNYNLHISYNSSKHSFFFSFLVIIYIIFFFFWIESIEVKKIIDILLLSLWFVGIKVFSIIWSLIFIFYEKKTRPFFSKSQIFRIIYDLMNIAFILILTYYLVPDTKIHEIDISAIYKISSWIKNGYENNNIRIIFMSTLLVFLFILQIVFIFLISIYMYKNEKKLMKIYRILCLYSVVLKIGPITIWFLENVSIEYFSWKEILYISVIYSLAVITFIISLTKKEAGGSSKVYLLFSTSTLFITIILLFGLVVWAKLNLFYGLSFALPAILFITILNIIIEPDLPPSYSSGYNFLITAITIYTVGIWALQLYIPIFTSSIPFDIQEIILVIPILAVLYLEIITIFVNWYTFRVISKKSWEIYRYEKGKKKIKKKYSKKGVYNG